LSASAISIRGVEKSFAGRYAVRDLDLEIPRGSLCGVLGPNGAGKSTTIRMILSIIYPDRGSIEVLGGNALAAKDRIGYLPEERGLYRTMKVREYLAYIARLKGVERRGLAQRVQSWLERIDLPDSGPRKCQELSKGMQQKVQFLAAVIHEPELVILDEPFSGLDPVNSVVLDRLIRELRAQGKTILLSTHVMYQAEKICDRLFLIHKGKKQLDASLPEIRARFDPRTIRYEPLEMRAGGEDAFARLNGVVGARRTQDGAAYELALAEHADSQAILRDLLALGPARSVALERVSLEEVFVRVVRQAEGEQAAAEAQEDLAHAQSV
jgi:ABC-2 type transport system ATP-binding protein